MDRDAPGPTLDRHAVARAFGRAGAGYDAAARLQATVRTELLSRLEPFALAPRVVLDAGAGTGAATLELARRYPRSTVIALDLAHGMLRQAGGRLGLAARLTGGRLGRRFERVQADVHRLPLADGCLQLCFSSLMLQWSDDLDGALRELHRALAPGAMLTFASLGPQTLRELREAWGEVDAGAHVNPFVDMHDLGAALARAGFIEPVLDVDRHRLDYADPLALMRELQRTGARNALADRARGMTGRSRLARMQAAYRAAHGRPDGRVNATWEVIYATCFRDDGPARRAGRAGFSSVAADPGDAADRPRPTGEVVIDVTRIGRRPRGGSR